MNPEFPFVSIALVSWNRRECLRETLSRIFAIRYPNFEVVLVDNGSTDGSADMVEKEFPAVRLVRLPKNMKLLARNISFRNSRGTYVVSLDDDSYPEPDAISKMVGHFVREPALGIIAFQIPCGDYFSTEYWPESDFGLRLWYIGAGAGMRRELFERIGYYDLNLEQYAEEIDFSYRALGAGYAIGHFKDVVAHHRTHKNPDRKFRFFYQNERNQQYLMGKFIHPVYWPGLFLRGTFYRLLSAYFQAGFRGLFLAGRGSVAGIRYAFLGRQMRVRLPPFVEHAILIERGYAVPLIRFFFSRTDRRRIMASIRRKYTDHELCPRTVDYRAHETFRLKAPKSALRFYSIRAMLRILDSRRGESAQVARNNLIFEYERIRREFASERLSANDIHDLARESQWQERVFRIGRLYQSAVRLIFLKSRP